VDVQKTMKSMIDLDGAKVIFPTSFGYFNPHVIAVAQEYPNVLFLHCGGLYDPKVHPKNVGTFFGYIDECQYLSGIVAAHATQATLAPMGYLTGAEWNWEKVYTAYVKTIKAGKNVEHLVRGGLKEGIVKTSAYGPAVKEEGRKAAEAVKAKFMDGSFVIFKG